MYLSAQSFAVHLALLHHEEHVIAVLASSPDNKGWHKVHREAANALEWSYDKLKKPSECDLKHQERRGHFAQEAARESMYGWWSEGRLVGI